MIKPNPFKYKCPKCGYTKVVKPKSDVVNLMDMVRCCPKCNTDMDKVAMNLFDRMFR